MSHLKLIKRDTRTQSFRLQLVVHCCVPGRTLPKAKPEYGVDFGAETGA